MSQIFSVVSFKKNDSPFQTHAPSLCVCVYCAHEGQRLTPDFSTIIFYLNFWDRISYWTHRSRIEYLDCPPDSWDPEFIDHVLSTLTVHQASEILWLPSPQEWDSRCTGAQHGTLHSAWALGIWSGPHACMESPLTNWAFSPVPAAQIFYTRHGNFNRITCLKSLEELYLAHS